MAKALREHEAREKKEKEGKEDGEKEKEKEKGKKELGEEDGPSGPAFVLALSGISTRGDVERFEACDARGILVGEALMRAAESVSRAT